MKRLHRNFAIMTTRPNAEVDDLHDRMPVILEEQDWRVWLGEAEGDHGALLRPAPDGTLRTWPVDRRVGSPRNNGPELLEPAAQPYWSCNPRHRNPAASPKFDDPTATSASRIRPNTGPRFLHSLHPNRTSRPAVLDTPQTSVIFVLDGGLLDSTLVRVAAVASAGKYDYALP
jgi:hypothetical protein